MPRPRCPDCGYIIPQTYPHACRQRNAIAPNAYTLASGELRAKRSDRIAHIWHLYYEKNLTLQEIGAVYGITRERTRQILSSKRARREAEGIPSQELPETSIDPIRIIASPSQSEKQQLESDCK